MGRFSRELRLDRREYLQVVNLLYRRLFWNATDLPNGKRMIHCELHRWLKFSLTNTALVKTLLNCWLKLVVFSCLKSTCPLTKEPWERLRRRGISAKSIARRVWLEYNVRETLLSYVARLLFLFRNSLENLYGSQYRKLSSLAILSTLKQSCIAKLLHNPAVFIWSSP